MADDISAKLAIGNYKELCAMLDEHKWKYEKDDDKLKITCTARGDDLPIHVVIKINTDMEIVALHSFMPFTVPQDKRNAIAIAVSCVNNKIVDGSFDYNYTGGELLFRMTSSYKGSLLDKEMFAYMLFVSCKTVDDYNDKFYEICRQDMTADQIIKFVE